MQILKNPCSEIFYNLVQGCSCSIKLCAPYIKSGVMDKITKVKSPSCKIKAVTSLNLGAIASKCLDLKALQDVVNNGGQLYNYNNLHAKIYIFDEKKAIITSGNLTYSGINTNYEYGVLLDSNLDTINKDFENLINADTAAAVTEKKLLEIEKIVGKMSDKIRPILDNEDSILFDIKDNSSILDGLSKWKKVAIELIDKLDKVEFTRQELLVYEDMLKKLFPKAKTPNQTLSRELQELRELGLLNFTARGKYKKLWI